MNNLNAIPFCRAHWEESPDCRRCHVTLSKEMDEEWPDDDRALLCPSCASHALDETLAALDSSSAALLAARRDSARLDALLDTFKAGLWEYGICRFEITTISEEPEVHFVLEREQLDAAIAAAKGVA